MFKRYIRIAVYIVLVILTIVIGVIIYSSNKSVKEVPKRAKLVELSHEQVFVG